MRLNHVSVKGYEETEDKSGFLIRAELYEVPSKLWIRLFHAAWLGTPASKNLSADIQFLKNDILFMIGEAETISETIDSLKKTIYVVDQQHLSRTDTPLLNLNQALVG